MLFLLSLFLNLFSAAIAIPTIHRRASVCNGHAELCSRSYGNVTYLTSHDSAISQNPLNLARDQEIDLTSQLNLGVRTLQAQSHMNNGILHFCHTSCSLFDGGSVLSYLQTVKTWLDANPNEVLTLIFTNPETVSPKDVWDPIFQQSGIAAMAYVPPHLPMKATDWPTLGDMIDSGKRVVAYLDYGANTADVPYLLPEFDHIWEPPFSVTDPTFPCRVDRISGSLSSQDHMFMINHNLNYQVFQSASKRSPMPMPTPEPGFWNDLTAAIGSGVNAATSLINHGVSEASSLAAVVTSAVNQIPGELQSILVPDFLHAAQTNSLQSIVANSDGCAAFSGGKAASFVLLDWVDIGEGMKAVDKLNGVV